MKQVNTVAAAAIAAMLAFAAPGIVAAGQADIVREASDRAQIDELMWRYSRAIDTWNADAYVATFTPDGSFGAVKGRDALHKMVLDFTKGRADREAKGEAAAPPLYHMETNQHLEFLDRDHARLHYYWITVAGAPPGKLSANVLAVGHGIDELVRVGGKWLIQSRQVAPTKD